MGRMKLILKNNCEFGRHWAGAFLLCVALIAPNTGAASDNGTVDNPAIEALGVFGEGTAVVYTDTLIAPQFHRGVLIHHVFYKLAFIVKDSQWQHIIERKLRLREVLLDELNRYSFARPKALKRINTLLLKKRLLLRAQKLFGETSILDVYLMDAITGRV